MSIEGGEIPLNQNALGKVVPASNLACDADEFDIVGQMALLI